MANVDVGAEMRAKNAASALFNILSFSSDV